MKRKYVTFSDGSVGTAKETSHHKVIIARVGKKPVGAGFYSGTGKSIRISGYSRGTGITPKKGDKGKLMKHGK